MSVLTENTIFRMNFAKNELGKDIATKEELLSVFTPQGYNISGQFMSKLRNEDGDFILNPDLVSEDINQVKLPSVQRPKVRKESPVVAMAAPVLVSNPTQEFTLDAGINFDSSGLIPRLDPNFVPYGSYNKIKKILKTNRFFPLYVTGPTGVGKSSMVKHICAESGTKFARVVITKNTTDEDLFGRMTLVNGNLKFVDGVMTLAAEMGFPIVLDEISAGDPRNLFGLYTILEGDRHFIKEANKFVEPRPGFNIICTDNTLGRGDDTGAYVGTNILNEAMLDRFAIALEQDYPSEKDEVEIFLKRMAANGEDTNDAKTKKFAANVAKWAGMIREAKKAYAVDDVVSTRRILVIADHYSIFGKELDAIKDACTRFGKTTAESFVDYYTKLVGTDAQEESQKIIKIVEELNQMTSPNQI